MCEGIYGHSSYFSQIPYVSSICEDRKKKAKSMFVWRQPPKWRYFPELISQTDNIKT